MPDPSPCLEPVTGTGCDGRVYGTICGALELGVCENTCEPRDIEVLGPHPCPMTSNASLTILGDPDAWAAFFSACAIPFMPPDFTTHDAVVACYACACAGEVALDRIRDCGAHAVVDFHYPVLCSECDACLPSCVVATTPRLPERVIDNLYFDDCGGPCCG
jgi:hypothetical protein